MAEYSTELNPEPQVSYLTSDHLGSPRIVTDNAGVVISRHDYMAFGDEVTQKLGNVGGRSHTQGYGTPENEFGSADDVRKQYTSYERDKESGLDYAQARYYNSNHGRFTSVDPLTASASIRDPQTFNRYSYVLNSPYKFTDPLGLLPSSTGACGQSCQNSGPQTDGSSFRGRDASFDWANQQYTQSSGGASHILHELIHRVSAENAMNERQMSPSEQFFVDNFFTSGAYFANPNDGDTYDQTQNAGFADPVGGGPRTRIDGHNHGFPSANFTEEIPSENLSIYIPAGGTVYKIAVDGENNKVVLVYFPKLGKLRNVTVAMFHVANIKLGPVEADGRRKIGEFGRDTGGSWIYRNKDRNIIGNGVHVHFEFYKGKMTKFGPGNGIQIKNKPPRVNPTNVM